MPPRKELCRNFQRGSCQYGDRCKFVHATPQQPKQNPFGFGMQNATSFQHTNQQQQMPNPFGFGFQNNTQSRGANSFGTNSNQSKPFENKWVRPGSNSNASAARQPDNQQPVAKHQCTDAESCKQFAMECLKSEKPLWKLTCYGHNGYGPCDIVGDISYEELRALAYDDAKHGKSLQFIVDRERSLLNSKLTEFQNLLQKPFTVPSAPSSQNPFGAGSPNPPVVNSFPPQVSSFSQLSGALTTGSAAVPNYAFGQPTTVLNNSHPSSSSMFQMNNSPFNSSSGPFGGQFPSQSSQSSYTFGSQSSSNSSVSGHGNPFSTLTNSSQTRNAFGSQSSSNSKISGHGNLFSTFANSSQIGNASDKQSDLVTNEIINIPKNTNVDDSIWKAQWKWNAGEIPEDAPPDIHSY